MNHCADTLNVLPYLLMAIALGLLMYSYWDLIMCATIWQKQDSSQESRNKIVWALDFTEEQSLELDNVISNIPAHFHISGHLMATFRVNRNSSFLENNSLKLCIEKHSMIDDEWTFAFFDTPESLIDFIY